MDAHGKFKMVMSFITGEHSLRKEEVLYNTKPCRITLPIFPLAVSPPLFLWLLNLF
jgi:hypothetical protein